MYYYNLQQIIGNCHSLFLITFIYSIIIYLLFQI